jgi:hypothetical protein
VSRLREVTERLEAIARELESGEAGDDRAAELTREAAELADEAVEEATRAVAESGSDE